MYIYNSFKCVFIYDTFFEDSNFDMLFLWILLLFKEPVVILVPCTYTYTYAYMYLYIIYIYICVCVYIRVDITFGRWYVSLKPMDTHAWWESAAREVPLFNSTDALRPAAARAGIALHPHVFGHKKAGELHPRNLTWNLKIMGFQMDFPFPGTYFQVPC